MDVVLPGVDLDAFHGRDRAAARAALGYGPDDLVVLFVGRIQPLKAPDLLVRAMSRLAVADPALASRVRLEFCGGPSGSGTEHPTALADLAAELGVPAAFHAPDRPCPSAPALRRRGRRGRAVALGVVRPRRRRGPGLRDPGAGRQRRRSPGGGRTTGCPDCSWTGTSPSEWAAALRRILTDDALRARLAAGARGHAETLSWDATVEGLLTSYSAALAAPRDALGRVG